MAALKTQKNDNDVYAFLETIEPEQKKEDALAILKLMEEVSGETACMWGDQIIGFGDYHYVYESGREGDWFKVGFSPRKQKISLYLMSDLTKHQSLLDKLGKYKTGKSCLYINKLKDINIEILKELIKTSIPNINKS